jgi:hypothetical protein
MRDCRNVRNFGSGACPRLLLPQSVCLPMSPREPRASEVNHLRRFSPGLGATEAAAMGLLYLRMTQKARP